MAPLMKVIHVDGKSSPPNIKISVSKKPMKQVTICPGLIGRNYIGDQVAFLVASLPSGNWNEIHILPPRNPGEDLSVTPETVPSEDIWEDWLEFQYMCLAGDFEEVADDDSDDTDEPSIVKFLPFPRDMRNVKFNTGMYRLLDDDGTGPKFVGRITEKHEVLGFLLVSNSDQRSATNEERELCQDVLSACDVTAIDDDSIINASTFIVFNGKPTLVHFEADNVPMNDLLNWEGWRSGGA